MLSRNVFFLGGIVLAVCGTALAAQPSLSTRSFTTGTTGSDPTTVTVVGSTITVDLSAISGATVYRATLDPYVLPAQSRARYDIRDSAGTTLELLPPRYLSFDATDAVRNAIASGTLTLSVVDSGQGLGTTVSLDVLCDRPAPVSIAQVTGAASRFADGDTMISFAEVNPPHTGTTWTVGGYNAARAAAGPDRSPKVRYRIYRSTVPFADASVLATAELVDEIMPMSGWNGRMYGLDPSNGNNDSLTVTTLPLDDLVLSNPGDGIYVRRHEGGAAPAAHYLVSRTLDGAEDFSALTAGGNVTGPVAESTGPGMTLEWKRERIIGSWGFNTVDATVHHFVQWECAPTWNLPSQALNHRLAVPHDTAVPSPPLEIRPHAWGGSYDSILPWSWYEKGSLLLTSNLHYYNSYTAFHECVGTLRSYDDGTVQPFHHARVLDFIFDFVEPTFAIDTDRIVLIGSSMGGAAGHFWGMRSGHIFAFLDAAVGNNIPAEDLAYEFEGIGEWGPLAWQMRFSNPQLVRFGYPEVTPQDNYVVWDYFDNTQWLAANPGIETPYISFANAPNDLNIGWPQAWKTTRAMQATRRPLNFLWDQGGHAQWSDAIPIDIHRDQSVPAFTNCSLDDDLGQDPNSNAPRGQLNGFLRWDPATTTDQPARWEMDIHLDAGAPETWCTADVTPRRLQNLVHAPGDAYHFYLVEGSAIRAEGAVRADAHGLLTLPGLTFSNTPRRVIVEPAPAASMIASTHHVPTSTGGQVDFAIDAGSAFAGRIYVVLGSVTGTVPGTPLPGGQATLPLNWDAMTLFTANYLNTGIFANFSGTLDASGAGAAQFNLPPLSPRTIGVTFWFGSATFLPWDWVSNPVGVELVP